MEPTKNVISFFEEFKKFALKGNVIDLAVGVIIGAAFGKIVDSLVKNIIMPLISLLPLSDQGYQEWIIPITKSKAIPVGLFIGDVVNFLIISFVLYIFIVKFVGWLVRSAKQEAAAVPPLTKDQQLLSEIRDLLKKTEAVK